MKTLQLIILLAVLTFGAAAQNVDDLVPVRLDGKWGYIDTNGVMVIEPQYYEPLEEMPVTRQDIDPRQENNDTSKFIKTVLENDKYSFADRKTGKIVIKPQFDEVEGFHNGFSIVKVNTKDTIKEEYDLAVVDELPFGETPIDYYVSSEGHTIYVYNGGFYCKYGYVSDETDEVKGVGVGGIYWSSSISDKPWHLSLSSLNVFPGNFLECYCGHSVRLVRPL